MRVRIAPAEMKRNHFCPDAHRFSLGVSPLEETLPPLFGASLWKLPSGPIQCPPWSCGDLKIRKETTNDDDDSPDPAAHTGWRLICDSAKGGGKGGGRTAANYKTVGDAIVRRLLRGGPHLQDVPTARKQGHELL